MRKTKTWVPIAEPIVVSELDVGLVHVSSVGFTIWSLLIIANPIFR
jgi:hypothetical protein